MMDRRRFLTLVGLTGGGVALLLPATKDSGTVKVDVKTMHREGDIITFKVER